MLSQDAAFASALHSYHGVPGKFLLPHQMGCFCLIRSLSVTVCVIVILAERGLNISVNSVVIMNQRALSSQFTQFSRQQPETPLFNTSSDTDCV